MGILVQDKDTDCWYLNLNSAPYEPTLPEGEQPPTNPDGTDVVVSAVDGKPPGDPNARDDSVEMGDAANGSESDSSTLNGSQDSHASKKHKGDGSSNSSVTDGYVSN